MKFVMKYRELEWWFWAVIGLTILFGLLGVSWGYAVALLVSIANLAYYALREKSLSSFIVQVREVWLALVLIAYFIPAMGWFFYLLFVGMILVVFFDRCGIALVLSKMPWNKGVSPT